jgi:hypothetical protein
VTLPAFGFLFLDVEARPEASWELLDDSSPGWTTGGGWATVSDPSAYGGTRIGGNAQGGFAERTFTGRAVEGYGRMGAQGAQTVEVLIDGVSHGVHSQRRPPPLSGGTMWQGQRLFAIGDLAPGEHTLRIVQRTASGIPGSPTNQHAGIDYLRTSPGRSAVGGSAAGATPDEAGDAG